VTEPLGFNSIERLGRAIFAALAPATGVRAEGLVTVVNPGFDTVELPPNTYMVPVVSDALREDLVFKIPGRQALTLEPGQHDVALISNVGGARHNLPVGTTFRFSPPIAGLEPTGALAEATTGGSDDGAIIRSVAMFEDLDVATADRDIFAALLGQFPACMLIWSQSEPAEGALGGLRQGANRGARRVRFWRETFVIHVITGKLGGDSARRNEGLVAVQAVCRLLSDRMQNDDGEQLSTVGAGVEIIQRARLARSQNHYIYGIRFRVNQTLEPSPDSRVFAPWLSTRVQGELPGRVAPEPTEGLAVVDDETPMP